MYPAMTLQGNSEEVYATLKLKRKSIELRGACKRMRKTILDMTYNVGRTGAHVGGSLSLVEIMAALYLNAMTIPDPSGDSKQHDRLILSKGHGVMALYAAMKEMGIIADSEIARFKQNDTPLTAHPVMNERLGIEFSSGSLGQGLSQGAGVCIALKLKGDNVSKVFVVVGDGECDEGQIWEAAMTAAHYGLSNLVCIVDRNHLQYDGETDRIKRIPNLSALWEGCGWTVAECDGHDVESLVQTLSANQTDQPYVVIANTVKGKGVSFMEQNASFHNASIDENQYRDAIAEIEATE